MTQARPRAEPKTKRDKPRHDAQRLFQAIDRLARARAFYTLVRGGLPLPALRRLLKDALPKSQAKEMPNEVWASLASSIAMDDDPFAEALGIALDQQLGWDKEPESLDDWWQAVRERPLEALWMAGLSETKTVRQEFDHLVSHCLENWRDSSDNLPPSWEYVEALLDVQAESARDLKDAEKRADDAERRQASDRERLEELRDELKRLRRENAELRGVRAEAERRLLRTQPNAAPAAPADGRAAELERRLRKAEKENEHLRRENERLAPRPEPAPSEPEPAASAFELPEPPEPSDNSIATDLNPRRRVIRQMLRKLVKKGKIGAAHTHVDNVYRGVADHEKGIAKAAIDVLYREGFLMPKPTATDPHVSIDPERMAQVRAMIAGAFENARLLRFLEE
jgi:hypothetical protein